MSNLQQLEIEEWQESLQIALQSDLEHGVALINYEAAEQFRNDFPELNSWISQFMDL